MRSFVLLALFGLAAQLVDGSLGMAYGVTSTTLLLASGLSPAIASASVHMAEVGTTLVSGLSHWKLGNTSWRAVIWLAVPGGVGAFFGALTLSSISAELAVPWIAAFLLCLGVYILARFTLWHQRGPERERSAAGRFLAPLGLGAGFLDAVGGGGWGPVTTPTLLAAGRMQPRHVIGTVDTSEFLVALGASAGFLVALERSSIAVSVVAALLLGGIVAAPLAAWLVRLMHPRLLGAAVGGLIVLTNSRTLSRVAGLDAEARWLIYAAILALWATAVVVALRAIRSEQTPALGVAPM